MASFIFDLYDKDDNAIECKGKGYYKEKDTWSDEYSSETEQITMDIEDAGWCGSGTAFPDGDHAIFWLWNDDLEVFCCFEIESDGSSDYTGDRQLLESQPPTVTLSVEDGTINKDVPASQTSSDWYNWSYGGVTQWHRDSWYGQTLCDQVGIDTVEYDFDDGDGYAEDDVHQYADIGDYDVVVKVTNKNGQETTDTITIRIRYNQPIVTLSNDPEKPKVDEDTTVTIDIDDPDETITEDTRYIDDDETTDTTFSWSEVDNHIYKVTLTWNDGYDDQTFDSELLIEMENQPPTLDMEAVENEDDGSGEWTIKSGADDPEDDLDHVNYWVYIDSDGILDPDDEGIEWVLINSGSVDLDLDLDIHINGDYKVVMQAVDGEGLKSDKAEVTFTEDDQEGGSSSDDCAGKGAGTITLQPDRFQDIAIPVKGKKVKDYFLDAIADTIGSDVSDVIEFVKAFPSSDASDNKYLIYKPGVSEPEDEGNFELVQTDGDYTEITAFRVRTKEFDGTIEFDWDTDDGDE